MTEPTKPDKYTEKERDASPLTLPLNLKSLMYKPVAQSFSLQPAFYTLIWASLTVTSTHSCSIAKILSKPEILIPR